MSPAEASVAFADGRRHGVVADGAAVRPLLEGLCTWMGLEPGCCQAPLLRILPAQREGEGRIPPARRGIEWVRTGDEVRALVAPVGERAELTDRLARLALVLSGEAENAGGVLLHGGLVATGGRGVILAGPGSVGKSTACARIPGPWRALSDDATLVARRGDGSYWAHPWPTWSRVREGRATSGWKVGSGVELAGIAVLAQGEAQALDRKSVV